MLSIPKRQARTESLPLLQNGVRLLHLTLTLLSNLMDLGLKFILLFGLRLISLLIFQAEAPEIDLADIE
jgi:hypothetical protein